MKAVFLNMGGDIAPPHRPRKREFKWDISTDSFMMDFENSCLEHHWDSNVAPPKGPKRFLDKRWAEMIKSQVYPNHSDVDWYEYVDWVSRGGGDDWFQEEVNE